MPVVDPAETEIDQMIVLFSKPLRHQVAFDRKTKAKMISCFVMNDYQQTSSVTTMLKQYSGNH